jgi:hypothetical protein
VGGKEHSYTVGGNANYCNHYGNQNGSSSKKLKIDLPYDPTIPLLGLYLKECESRYRELAAYPCLLQLCSQ